MVDMRSRKEVCWDKDGTPSVDDYYKFIDGQETINYWIDIDGLSQILSII